MTSEVVRPYGIFIEGRLEVGLEALIHEGTIVEVRPHTGLPEPFLLSPAFVNAHSHLEYRGMLGQIRETSYWPWIREITQRKRAQSAEEVLDDCRLAALENRATGVWQILEHTDRYGAAPAMRQFGLEGMLFQEVITFFEHASPAEKLSAIYQTLLQNDAQFSGPVLLNPHAYHTVDRATLASFSGQPISIHVAEAELENQFTREGAGEIANFYCESAIPFAPTGKSVVASLEDLGLAHPGAQFVHCCAVSEGDIEILRRSGVRIAHCPRSNRALGCPDAPVREFLDAGIDVGLGLDSAASSGPIDMFAEMRAAIEVSLRRGRSITGEEVWRMATGNREIIDVPAIKIHLAGFNCADDVIERATPKHVEWLAFK